MFGGKRILNLGNTENWRLAWSNFEIFSILSIDAAQSNKFYGIFKSVKKFNIALLRR